jgi:hypothetical protein
MEIAQIHDLAPAEYRAVIINVNTRLVTTLALMSALRYAAMPILLIDCESTDGSMEHFRQLMERHDFDLLSAPLQGHGHTLDWLFTTIPARYCMLIDSDIEILGQGVVDMMRMLIRDPRAFGSGFVHAGSWMTIQKMPFGFYEERPWIPLTMLTVEKVRTALRAGCSFVPRKVFNDFPRSYFISRLLVARFRLPVLRDMRLGWLDLFRKEFHGRKPSFLYYDTGAVLYQYLKHEAGDLFHEVPWRFTERYVTHFHGVTRLLLNPDDPNGTQLATITQVVAQRLKAIYKIDMKQERGAA